jgi:hypothetical protein
LPGQKSQSHCSARPVGLLDLLVVVLREVAGLRLVPPLDLAGVGRQLAHDDLEQRRLADAVRAHDHQPVAALHARSTPCSTSLSPNAFGCP